jgi:sugar lactone lactonase YvrE
MAVSPKSGDLYVTDGYGNSRVHRYSSDGKHVLSWGGPGCEPGEFQAPHNVVIDTDENIFIADRENNRVQVFDNTGKVLAIWHDIYRPDGMCMDKDGLIYIGELLGQVGLEDCPILGHRIGVYTKDGKRLARLGDPQIGDGPGQFIAPHGMAVDSAGNLFVGEVSFGMKGRHEDPPRTYRNFRRLRRVR